MFNNNQSDRHFNGNWNPDNHPQGHPQGHPHGHPQGHPHGHSQGHPQSMASALPTVIDSDLSVYVLGGLVAYSVYTKYFQKKDYDGDGIKEGCPVTNEPLNFNR